MNFSQHLLLRGEKAAWDVAFRGCRPLHLRFDFRRDPSGADASGIERWLLAMVLRRDGPANGRGERRKVRSDAVHEDGAGCSVLTGVFRTAVTHVGSGGARPHARARSGKGCFNLSLNLPLIVASSAHILTFSSINYLCGLKRLAQIH